MQVVICQQSSDCYPCHAVLCCHAKHMDCKLYVFLTPQHLSTTDNLADPIKPPPPLLTVKHLDLALTTWTANFPLKIPSQEDCFKTSSTSFCTVTAGTVSVHPSSSSQLHAAGWKVQFQDAVTYSRILTLEHFFRLRLAGMKRVNTELLINRNFFN